MNQINFKLLHRTFKTAGVGLGIYTLMIVILLEYPLLHKIYSCMFCMATYLSILGPEFTRLETLLLRIILVYIFGRDVQVGP